MSREAWMPKATRMRGELDFVALFKSCTLTPTLSLKGEGVKVIFMYMLADLK